MPLEAGAAAPPIVLRDQHGQTRNLVGPGSAAGRALVVFFPFAFSGICSSELAGLNGAASRFREAGITLTGISCDPIYSLRAMSDCDDLDLMLLSDFWPHGQTAREYGCFDESIGAPSRSSFLIDEAGTIQWALHRGLAEERSILEHLAAL